MSSSSLSHLAETLIGSEIVKLGADIREKIKQGNKIHNYTIGDFDSSVFPIPKELENEIIDAYQKGFTTYPPADGIVVLKEAVAEFISSREGLNYSQNEILIAAGGRPLIYAAFRAIVDKGDKVIYPVPSWNNNHYTHFTEGNHVVIESKAENKFMPLACDIAPYIKGATLLALCSPLNPTGTTFTREQLEAICDLVIAENESRGESEKKLYVLYDQIYWTLTYGETQHYNPVSLRPNMKDYTIFVDGISKAFAATGVRVGWSMGPAKLIDKMKAINSHVGAWAPMAEQKAVSNFLKNDAAIDNYFSHFKKGIEDRLHTIHNGFQEMKSSGLPVDSITPEAAIYLTVKIDLVGKTKPDGEKISKQSQVTEYLLSGAQLAIVPFSAFGGGSESPWYRISVGTMRQEEIDPMLSMLKGALEKLR